MRTNRILKIAVAYTLAAASSVALAENAPTSATLDTVIVTGSYIKGTAEDAALPVQVISAEDLAKQGSPSTLEILKSLSVSNGVLGDSNQFDARAQGSEGSGSVNLRGFGPARTLVLLNGRRLVNSPFTGAPDTNLLPTAAIGRAEVLKDGAAATYGSDAIAGVVNFISKTGKTAPGFEFAGDYKYIQSSDGDYTGSLSYGGSTSSIDYLVAAGYQHRSELMARDRDWATRSYLDNPQGGYSAAGNPATFVPEAVLAPGGNPSPIAGAFRDPQCAPLGGFAGYVPAAAAPFATPVCYWQYSKFDALTEKEDRYQVYAELNAHFAGDTKLHVEGLYSGTEIPIYRTSPSYAALQIPCGTTATALCTAGTSPDPAGYFVPSTNPGYIAFNTANPGVIAAGATGARVVAYRPFAIGGNPLFDYGSSEGPRRYHAYRGSADLSGSFSDSLNWDVALTYMRQDNHREGRDTVVNRLEYALRGLGGPNCNGIVAGTAGSVGCSWLNPFSTAIPRNAISGAVNMQFLTNGVPNSDKTLVDWLFPTVSTDQKTDLFVVDSVLNGTTGLHLGGGDIGWAAGVQYRNSTYSTSYSDLNNFAVVPCINSIGLGTTIVAPTTACTPAQLAAPAGPLLFLGGSYDSNFSQHIYGVFSELSLPFFDSFQAQLAARYENYGGSVGSTFNPKLQMKWQIVDAFALRGSVGTTFRGPPLNQLSTDTVTTLQSILGTFRAVRTAGNPNLKPEKAFTYNVGALVKAGGFKASLDYWNFRFENQIVNEPVAGITDKVFGASGSCASPLAARFFFNGLACSASNIARLDINVINGPTVNTSGLDLDLKYEFDFGLSFGVNATYVLEYKTDSLAVDGVDDVQVAYDAAGKLNYQTTAYPLPKIKGSLFADYAFGKHNLRWVVSYVDSYEDQRTDIFAPSAATNPGGVGNTNAGYIAANNLTLSQGKIVSSTTLHSLYYQVQLPADLSLTLGVENIFNKDPSFARLDYSYDPFTGSAFGRTAKVGLRMKF